MNIVKTTSFQRNNWQNNSWHNHVWIYLSRDYQSIWDFIWNLESKSKGFFFSPVGNVKSNFIANDWRLKKISPGNKKNERNFFYLDFWYNDLKINKGPLQLIGSYDIKVHIKSWKVFEILLWLTYGQTNPN